MARNMTKNTKYRQLLAKEIGGAKVKRIRYPGGNIHTWLKAVREAH